MKLLILSDLNPNIKIGKNLDKYIEESDYILFNLEGSPNFKNEYNKPNQMLKFQINDLRKLFKKYDSKKFIISLANNHILDNGDNNFNELIKFLNEYNIKYIGTKDQPYIEIDDFVFYSFVSWETGINKKSYKYLNSIKFSHKKIFDFIESKKNKNIILYPHWGMDLYQNITKNHLNFINKIISKENVFLYGHHPHLIIKENAKDNFIFSLGNTYISYPYYYRRFGLPVRYSKAIFIDKNKKTKIFTLFFGCLETEISTKYNQKDFILNSKHRKIPRPRNNIFYNYLLKIILNILDVLTSSKIYRNIREVFK